MRKFLLAASAAALMAACGGTAQAQGGDDSGRSHGGMLFQADANQDGAITRAEFDAGRSAMFARLDANSDGSVTREERRESFRAMREQRHEQRGERRDDRWQAQDADSNGSISREEFLARPGSHFDELDVNNDGQLSADERPQRGEHGGRGGRHHGRHGGMMGEDANNDGSITRAEFDAGGLAMFQRMDANNDGQVTRAEAEVAHPHRRAPT